ncbi:MAG: hypothetical protein ACI9M3_002162, partial [Bacteroidia bacterium]
TFLFKAWQEVQFALNNALPSPIRASVASCPFTGVVILLLYSAENEVLKRNKPIARKTHLVCFRNI